MAKLNHMNFLEESTESQRSIFDVEGTFDDFLKAVKFTNHEKSIEDIEIFASPNITI